MVFKFSHKGIQTAAHSFSSCSNIDHIFDNFTYHFAIGKVPLSIVNIENMDEQKISALRVALLGLIGVFWKKKCMYTVVQYNDGIDDQTVVLDFGKK